MALTGGLDADAGCRGSAELLFRRSREERLSDEIAHHLELLVEDLKRGGMSDADARLAARKQFGGVDQVRMTSS